MHAPPTRNPLERWGVVAGHDTVNPSQVHQSLPCRNLDEGQLVSSVAGSDRWWYGSGVGGVIIWKQTPQKKWTQKSHLGLALYMPWPWPSFSTPGCLHPHDQFSASWFSSGVWLPLARGRVPPDESSPTAALTPSLHYQLPPHSQLLTLKMERGSDTPS